jgi:hypothetical protein
MTLPPCLEYLAPRMLVRRTRGSKALDADEHATIVKVS